MSTTNEIIDNAAQLIAQAMANAGADMPGDTRELARQVLLSHPAIRTAEIARAEAVKEPGFLYEVNTEDRSIWRIPVKVVEDALIAHQKEDAKEFPAHYADPDVWLKRPVAEAELHDWLGDHGEQVTGWELVYSILPKYDHNENRSLERNDGDKLFPVYL